MSAATLNKINAAISKHHVEVIRGEGYFYFQDLPTAGEEFPAQRIASVWSAHLRCMSLEDWIAHVEREISGEMA